MGRLNVQQPLLEKLQSNIYIAKQNHLRPQEWLMSKIPENGSEW